MTDFSHVTFISAGAGSGKTWRLTEELERLLVEDAVDPARIIGTTFTVKAAAELRDRVRERLIASGRFALAERSGGALIGTVHSVCERVLRRFAFELGLSPRLDVASVEDSERLFDQALDDVLDRKRIRDMNARGARLELDRWQGAVKRIADLARDNDLDAAALIAMGRENADALLAFFPVTAQDDLTPAFREAVEHALSHIDLDRDRTQTTTKYVARLRTAAPRLGRPDCPWSVWMSLSKEKPAKASQTLAEPVWTAASRYDAHPLFHADLRSYTEDAFEIAARALDRFAELKRRAGLIDFGDMEQLMLRALSDRRVTDRLRDELEVLLVDEFQDTNPMQLALFVKLAALADRVIFVGDVKQAIFGFRGCDQALVFDTLEELAAGDAATVTLEDNWRSRAPLVDYVNTVFATAFRETMDPGRVLLKPQRDAATDEPAVARWTLAGRGFDDRFQALAEGVADLVAGGYRVVDPDTGDVRPVRYGDIAVLARTNPHVEGIARALRSRRVPMKMTMRGLLAVPETGLARACLRCLNDDSDTLAVAEVVALAGGDPPETWLADRLAWLADGRESRDWDGGHPIVQRLRAMRQSVASLSPLETVVRILNDVGIRETVTAWGPDSVKAAQRQRNLDALLDLAVLYEEHCAAQHEAASLTGFLFWLEEPSSPELDLQPVVTAGDAVHILTYHRAKGLEWPVVVLTDFDYEEMNRLWEPRVTQVKDFDIELPAAGTGRAVVAGPVSPTDPRRPGPAGHRGFERGEGVRPAVAGGTAPAGLRRHEPRARPAGRRPARGQAQAGRVARGLRRTVPATGRRHAPTAARHQRPDRHARLPGRFGQRRIRALRATLVRGTPARRLPAHPRPPVGRRTRRRRGRRRSPGIRRADSRRWRGHDAGGRRPARRHRHGARQSGSRGCGGSRPRHPGGVRRRGCAARRGRGGGRAAFPGVRPRALPTHRDSASSTPSPTCSTTAATPPAASTWCWRRTTGPSSWITSRHRWPSRSGRPRPSGTPGNSRPIGTRSRPRGAPHRRGFTSPSAAGRFEWSSTPWPALDRLRSKRVTV